MPIQFTRWSNTRKASIVSPQADNRPNQECLVLFPSYCIKMKIIHTADWQLGKPFGRFDQHVRAALTDARFDAIDAIGQVAAQHNAGHVLVAGDVFDTDGPEDR